MRRFGICSQLVLAKLRDGAWVRLPRARGACTPTSFAITNCFPNTYRATIHNSCICNEIVSLHNRHLIDRSHIPYDHAEFTKAFEYSRPQLMKLSAPWTNPWQIAKSYTGGKRRVYMRACQWLESEGIRSRDFKLSMFVKPDKYPVAVAPTKPPRAIQFRTPKYNLLLASHLKGLEHSFYREAGDGVVPDIAKGRNAQQRASDLLEKSARFKQPIFYNSDYSKMDSCVRVEMQRLIFSRFYLRKRRSRMLNRLLRAQLKNVGKTKRGIKYGVPGTRASGDYNTGFENTLINFIVLRWILHAAGIYGEIYIDGDDAIIIVETWDAPKLEAAFSSLIGKLGFEVKLIKSKTLHQTPFCQSKLIECEEPMMARNPLRALANHNISLKNYPAKVWPRLHEAKMLCEFYSNPGSPVLMPIARDLLTGVDPLFDPDQRHAYELNRTVHAVDIVTPLARVLYHQAWGISPHEQELLEQAPHMVSCGLNSVTGRTHGTTTFQRIAAEFEALGDDVDYGRFSNW